ALSAGATAATIASKPAAAESFQIGGIHVDRYGSGDRSIIFVPGLASGPWTWYEQIARFAPQYTVYSLTLAGFDGTPASDDSDKMATFSRDFFGLLDARHVSKPVVVGHSLGGTLAIMLAEEHSERLGGIVAVDGLPVYPLLAQASVDARATAGKTAAAQYQAMSHDQLVQYETNFLTTMGTTDPKVVATLANLVATSDSKTVAAWLQADFNADLRPQLSKINVPFLEVMPYAQPYPYSESDTLAFYKQLLSGAPTAQVLELTPARHYAMLDQPDKFDALLTTFLNSVH
ncbi:MAG: alpha/beta hydrolase, partial [Candidatus Eremiobacteraeota bacterium]|nr:alpha/beta hydrolase [Candidatus Eremiobacteraeota bacterium]